MLAEDRARRAVSIGGAGGAERRRQLHPVVGRHYDTSGLPTLPIAPEAAKYQSNHLFSERCSVSDLSFGVHTHPYDEANHLRTVTPAQPVAFSTDRQVVIGRLLAA